MLTQQLVNGLTLGFAYGMLAAGLTLGQTMTGVLNFAHGDFFVLAAFISLVLQAHGWPFAICVLTATVVVALVALTFEVVVLEAVKGNLQKSLATIALSLGLTDAMLLIFGADTASFRPVYPEGVLHLGSAVFDWGMVISALILCLVVIAFSIFMSRARMAIAFRATAEQPMLAEQWGIPVLRYQRIAVLLAAVLASCAAQTVGPLWQINYSMGSSLTIKAFAAAMIGGLGNPRGAVIGGLLLGLSESLFAAYISSSWRDMFVYALVLVLLLFRAGGLMKTPHARLA